MKYVLSFLFVLFFVTAYAGETKKVESDLNNDGKIDRIETYQGDQLIAVERDSDFSGKINEWITYSPYVSDDKAIEVVKKDTNGDGKVDRIETLYKDFKHKLYITKIEIDSKFNGNFDVKYTTTTPLDQKKDEVSCDSERDLSDFKASRFADNLEKVTKSMGEGYTLMSTGQRVHQSCFDRWGKDAFTKIVDEGMKKGLQCLSDLAKKNDSAHATPNGAKINLANLNHLLKSEKVAIVCNETSGMDWKGKAGHASTEPTGEIKGTNVKHPFLSLNPNDPKVTKKATADESLEMMSTIFHEQLHNLGFRHGSGIEYPYLCEACCILKTDPKEKAAACKICAGAYTGANDKRYVNDMIAYMREGGSSDLAMTAALAYSLEKPRDRAGIFQIADVTSGSLSPVGLQMGELLKKKFTNLSAEEKNHLATADLFMNYGDKALKENSVVVPAKFVAQGYVSYYYEHNTKDVLDAFEKNKSLYIDVLKNELDAIKAKDSKRYLYDNIKIQYKTLLHSVWADNMGTPEGTRAFRLMDELKLL